MKSILVIGGGLVGAAAALRLQAAGIAVTLIDPGVMRRGASFGNAGHIGPEQVMPWSSWDNLISAPKHLFALGGPLDFRWSDVDFWAPWALRFMAASEPARVAAGHEALKAILRDAMGAWLRLEGFLQTPGLVRPHGQANVWMSARKAERARETWLRTPTGTATWRDMNAEELERYRGALYRPPEAGIVFSGTGQVRDPQGAREAMLAQLTARGGEIVAGRVTALSVGARARASLAAGGPREADALLIAAGAWSRGLMQSLGVAAPLVGERGYSIQSKTHAWPADLPTTIFEERSVVVSRFDSGLRMTGFLEFGRPDAPADARKWRQLEHHIDDLGIAFPADGERWVGPRPTLPDYLPANGRLARAENVFYAFGHAHLGLTMCAITAEVIEALACERALPFELAPFRIERFA